MKKNRGLIALTVTAALMSGCAPNIKPESLDYGTKPMDYLKIVENFEKRGARDPESIEVRESLRLRKIYTYRRLTGGDVKAGWAACYEVNGKNAYGGYAGWQHRFALINNGYVIKYETNNQAVDSCLSGL